MRDRRAEHLRGVLAAGIGAQIRAGVVGGGIGRGEVLADDGETITLRLTLGEPPSAPLPIELVLAIPRPKVLTRVIEAAASFGVAQIALTNAWRVDKSYLSSPRLAADALTLAARLGAEQGATTHQPVIDVHRRLMSLLDARWPAGAEASGAHAGGAIAGDAMNVGELANADDGMPVAMIANPGAVANPGVIASAARPPARRLRLLAHPGAPPIERALVGAPPDMITLAIGPEGGWIAREVETFLARGFVPVSIGAPILRVESAVAAALGQLLLLRRLALASALSAPA